MYTCRQNHELMTRLLNLEDESKAVKESLVQLVTEKAATNKALAIENQRLRVKVTTPILKPRPVFNYIIIR